MRWVLLAVMLFCAVGCQGNRHADEGSGRIAASHTYVGPGGRSSAEPAHSTDGPIAREIVMLGEEQRTLERQMRDILLRESGFVAALEARDSAVLRFKRDLSEEQAELFSAWLQVACDSEASRLAMVQCSLELAQSLSAEQFTEFQKLRQLQNGLGMWTTKVNADCRPLVRRHSEISDRIIQLAAQYYGQ